MIERASGAWVYDVSGKPYLDCLASYSALNQGHCHPRILPAMIEQARRLTLTSRAFRNTRPRSLARIELDRRTRRPYCEALASEGVLCKETREVVIRVSPPLVIAREEIDWAVERFRKVLSS